MALGRKRRWAGCTLIGLGFAFGGLIVASRGFVATTAVDTGWSLAIGAGVVRVGWQSDEVVNLNRSSYFGRFNPPELRWKLAPAPESPFEHIVDVWILRVDRLRDPIGLTLWYGTCFLWPLALAMFVGGAPLLLSGRRAQRRAQQGRCPSCGYNLAGLTLDSSCPECGLAQITKRQSTQHE